MSAFVVDPETITTIVKSLEIASENRYPSPFPSIRYMDSNLLADMVNEPEELGKAMYSMNINAVEQRYPESELPGTYGEDDRLLAYEYNAPVFSQPDPLQVFKSLECYLYQCSEGNVPELFLYKSLEEYKNLLACHIVGNLPEYNKANWG